MFKTFNLIKKFRVRYLSGSNQKMEEIARKIFKAAVDASKPHELITNRHIISLKKDLNREFIEIKNNGSDHKIDVTDKNIHMGSLNYLKKFLKYLNCKLYQKFKVYDHS